jgi:hypothetical protein
MLLAMNNISETEEETADEEGSSMQVGFSTGDNIRIYRVMRKLCTSSFSCFRWAYLHWKHPLLKLYASSFHLVFDTRSELMLSTH